MAKKVAYLFIFLAFNISAQNFIGCNKGLDSYVSGLYNDTILNKLIVFGSFNFADGKLVRGMATWDGQNFDSLGSGDKRAFGGHKEMMIRYKNKLYVQFQNLYLHCYDYNTKQWQQIPGVFGGLIWDAAILNDELYLVGDFDSVGTTKVKNIIKFNGQSYDTLAKRPLFSFNFFSVAAYKGEIYAGGIFDALPFQGLAKFNGIDWVSASPNLTMDGGPEVWDFEIYNEKLFMCGKWTNINGEYNPSFAAWDGQRWYNLGGLTFNGGITAAVSLLRIYKNKLYVFGGVDYADTVKTHNIAVWNDTIWCGVKMVNNTGIQNAAIENYRDQWYFRGSDTMSGDTIPVTGPGQEDTINYLGIYVGNNGKLERNCFDKPPKDIEEIEGVYPNPTQDIINLNLSNYFGEKCNLKIINNLGQIISNYEHVDSHSKLSIENLSAGIYVFLFYNKESRKTFKIVKV